ncbi:Hypothetical protein Y17_4438 [Pectobacterium wasabiae CFBP 3304]|nr:Hypothetical protein Y17_4438 [Pectobacterium wasabiae CFBP 3304]
MVKGTLFLITNAHFNAECPPPFGPPQAALKIAPGNFLCLPCVNGKKDRKHDVAKLTRTLSGYYRAGG